MRTFRSVLAALLFPLIVVAEETPKFEVFGGYSYLRLNGESSSSLNPANLNGWNASFKWNFVPRIGLVGDFGGNYGQRGTVPFALFLMKDNPLIRTNPGKLRQHTFLFGPEVRLLDRGRMTVNGRVLIGVAHTNTLVVPFQEPIQLPLGPNGELITITKRPFFGGSNFAAAIGGSLDYRISDRLSYRVQPEVVLVRRNGSESTQSAVRVSSGITYRFGPSGLQSSSEKRFSFGLVGGGSLTDGFGQEASFPITLTNGGTALQRSRWASTHKDYIVGPMVEFGFSPHLSLEIDALYRPLNFADAIAQPGEAFQNGVSMTVVTWEFPILTKYTIPVTTLKPFIEVGPSFRSSGNLNGTAPSNYGGTAGIGIQRNVWKLNVAPVLRFTHWARDGEFFQPRTKRNQLELLVGFSF